VRQLTGLIVLLIGILAGASAAMGEDPIGAELDRLKGLYAEAVNREKTTVDAAFEAAIKAAATAGDLDTVEVLTAERKAFSTGGKLPASQSMGEAIRAYRRKKMHFNSTMLLAYDKAVKQYTQQLKIEEATQVREQSRAFAEAANSEFARPPSEPKQTVDLTSKKLDVAKDRQTEAYEAARKEMIEAFDREIRALAARGDLDGFQSVQALKALFEKEDDISQPKGGPLQRAKQRYDQQLAAASDQLAAAYRSAIREYTKSGRSEQAQALEDELLLGVGIGPKGWLVVFRSADPSLWNKDRNTPAGMALEIKPNVPESVRYVRIRRMDTGDSVITDVTKRGLSYYRIEGPGDYGWNGSNGLAPRGASMGIFHKDWTAGRDEVSVGGSITRFRRRGWGFGNVVAGVDAPQRYAWEGKPLARPVVFEISVTAQELTERERKLLLQ